MTRNWSRPERAPVARPSTVSVEPVDEPENDGPTRPTDTFNNSGFFAAGDDA